MTKPHWTAPEETRLKVMYEAGMPWDEISACLGRSLHSVRKKLSSLGHSRASSVFNRNQKGKSK